MDTKAPLEALRVRAFEARIPIYKLCERARISAATFTRANQGVSPTVTTLGRLERAMTAIEQEQSA